MPKKFMYILVGLTMFFTTNSLTQAQNLRKVDPDVPVPYRLVDFPTAKTLPRASFLVRMDAFSAGGILSSIDIGLHDRFMLGISYGGTHILGEGKADWNERPEYLVKLMLIDETLAFPAITVGFESQGAGPYDDEMDRYRFKAPGFYIVASKGYRLANWLAGLHAGINMNPLEDEQDNDDDVSFFAGMDITFNNNLSFVGEYQAAWNDNINDHIYGKGNGYLNFGFKWTFSERLELTAIIKDVLDNTHYTESITRELRFTYIERF